MLNTSRNEVRKHYFDTKFGTVDLDAKYAEYDRRLGSARNLNEGYAAIAGFMGSLNDSHTYFEPPRRLDRSDSGFTYAVIGSRVFITNVRPGTDAALKLHAGEEIVLYDGQRIGRENFDAMQYYFDELATLPYTDLELFSKDGTQRHERVANRLIRGRATENTTQGDWANYWRYQHQAYLERNREKIEIAEHGSVAAARVPSFLFSEATADDLFRRLSKFDAVVLDLRDNPGGSEDALLRFIGHFFDKDVTVATLNSRKSEKPRVAHGHGKAAYQGKVFVLVDASTASAAEIFARVMQIEKRGSVLGDRTAGAVMEATFYPE